MFQHEVLYIKTVVVFALGLRTQANIDRFLGKSERLKIHANSLQLPIAVIINHDYCLTIRALFFSHQNITHDLSHKMF